jgi:hypothetical protein
VLTEGRTTEVEYFGMWARELRDQLVIDFDRFHGTPLPLVERAVGLLEDRNRAIRRGREVEFDEIVCVFDRDEHPYVDEARALARAHDITVGYSNPCFELWLALHSQDVRRHVDRHEVQRLAAALGLLAGKSIPMAGWDVLRRNLPQAHQRAERLDDTHRRNGTQEGANPSTSLPRVVNLLLNTNSEGS